MAAGVYLQEAAKRLRDATAALRDDIHSTQSETYRTETQLHNSISQAEVESAEIRTQLRLTSDPRLITRLEGRLRQLENEVRTNKAETSRLSNEAARSVQAKNDLLANLESMVHQLESMAASVR